MVSTYTSIANENGSQFRSDLNAALAQVFKTNAGHADPTATGPYAGLTTGWQAVNTTTSGSYYATMKVYGSAGWASIYTLTSGNSPNFLADSGSSAYASYQFTGDPNTGIYHPASDQVGIAVGGTCGGLFTSVALPVTASAVVLGNGDSSAAPVTGLVRGTSGSGTNVAGGALNLAPGAGTGSGAGGDFVIWAGNSAGSSGSSLGTLTESIRVKPAGISIGGGGTAPAAAVHIKINQAATTALRVENANTSTTNATFGELQASNGSVIARMGVAGASASANIGMLSASTPYVYTDAAPGLGIAASAGGAPIRFYTDGTVAASERVRITSAGTSISAGSATPATALVPLHVRAGTLGATALSGDVAILEGTSASGLSVCASYNPYLTLRAADNQNSFTFRAGVNNSASQPGTLSVSALSTLGVPSTFGVGLDKTVLGGTDPLLTVANGGLQVLSGQSQTAAAVTYVCTLYDAATAGQGVGAGITLAGNCDTGSPALFAGIQGRKTNSTAGNTGGDLVVAVNFSGANTTVLYETARFLSDRSVILGGSTTATASVLKISTVSGAATVSAAGTQANCDLVLLPIGTGATYVGGASGATGSVLKISTTASAVTLTVAGTSTTCDIIITPIGAGRIKIGNSIAVTTTSTVNTVMSAVGPTGCSPTITGWIPVKDSQGSPHYVPYW